MSMNINKLSYIRTRLFLRRARRPGFTLVEVMVATVVTALGFVAASSMVIHSSQSTALSKARTVALYLAESKLEELSRAKYSSVVDTALDNSLPSAYTANYTRSWVVEDGKPANRMKTVTVTVKPNNSRLKPIVLSTIIVNL